MASCTAYSIGFALVLYRFYDVFCWDWGSTLAYLLDLRSSVGLALFS